MLYFAFGSNMNPKRFLKRVPSAKFVTVAELPQHTFRFHKIGADGTAKADAFFTGNLNDVVYGVIYEISRQHKLRLDYAEGLHFGYEIKRLRVFDAVGTSYYVFFYYATSIDDSLLPKWSYKKHVVEGATHFNLPKFYIAELKAMECLKPLPLSSLPVRR